MTLEDQLDQLLRHDPTALDPIDITDELDDEFLDLFDRDLDALSIDELLR